MVAPAPNPATARVTVRYRLPAAAHVRLTLVDARGREVAVMANGPAGAGEHEADVHVGGLAAGLYVIRLRAGGEQRARTLTVAR